MEVNISPDKIKDIGGYLEAGMKCWYRIPTEEILYAPDSNSNFDIDYENWQDIFDEIDTKMHECIPFEGLDSRESFEIMECFVENEVIDRVVRARLIDALNMRKPFSHFNAAIRYYDKYLKAWYAYKTKWYIDHVKEAFDFYNQQKKRDEKYADEE